MESRIEKAINYTTVAALVGYMFVDHFILDSSASLSRSVRYLSKVGKAILKRRQ